MCLLHPVKFQKKLGNKHKDQPKKEFGFATYAGILLKKIRRKDQKNMFCCKKKRDCSSTVAASVNEIADLYFSSYYIRWICLDVDI